MIDGLPETPSAPVTLEVRRDVARALLNIVDGVLAGSIDGLRIEWDGGAVCRIAAHQPEALMVIPANGRQFAVMKARG